MKKNVLFIVMAFIAINLSAQKFWNFSDAIWEAKDYTEQTVIDGLSINPSSSGVIAIDGNNKSIDGYSFTKRLKLGGTGTPVADGRNISFEVTGPSKIIVYGMASSAGATDRSLIIHDGTTELYRELLLGDAIYKHEYDYAGGATTLYLYSSTSGLNFYGIKVEGGSTPPPAPGIWKASYDADNVITYQPSVAIETGIAGLTVMHNDDGAPKVADKQDPGATPVSYGGITWDNEAHIQGNSNGMFYAISADADGTLDVSVKMSNGKNTFVAETNDAITTVAAQTITGTDRSPLDKITDPAFPQVYDTYNNNIGTWNNTAPINPTPDPQYLVMSFSISAGKTYIVGCDGSKLMLRGLAYIPGGREVSIPTLTTNKVVRSVEYYDLMGRRVLNENQRNTVLIKKTTYVDGTISSTKVITKAY
jgi:hypothetical protein